MKFSFFPPFVLIISFVSTTHSLLADQLYIGHTSTDISPTLPVAVTGQFNLRIAEEAETPLTANVLVLENQRNNLASEIAVLVSCDVLYIPVDLIREVREKVKATLPDLEVEKIIFNATHTHTAPVLLENGEYLIPKEGVTQVKDYRDFFVKQISEAIIQAWNTRTEGAVAWGLSYAVAGYNRRISYSDGTAGMNSNTNLPEFRNLEGSEDHDVNTLFFWDKAGKLLATVVGVASPAQEVESRVAVNADFWHPVREGIRNKYGQDVTVIALLSAAGDLSPHLRYRKAADDRMRELRNLSRTEEIARRIIQAVDESYQTVKEKRHFSLAMEHKTEMLPLPERLVTERNFREAKTFVSEAKSQIQEDPENADRLFRMMKWQEATLERYQKQSNHSKLVYEMELHVIRLGDVALCTNEFELFSDYGIRIQARSKALQTFVIQLAGSPAWGSYLPTTKAVEGGAYSAVIHSSLIGPEGGQILVDRTVELINSMW